MIFASIAAWTSLVAVIFWSLTGVPRSRQSAERSLAEACQAQSPRGATVAAISAAFDLEDNRTALSALGTLGEPLRAAAKEKPDDVDAQYHLALWLGARVEHERGRRKIPIAQEMQTSAQRVLALQPRHAGANFLMGRLHAGVMRMDRLTRFLATHLFGGALKGASWQASQSFLELAERADPCEPEHHYELALGNESSRLQQRVSFGMCWN